MRTESEVAAMQCPVCRVPLAMSDRQGIEIDYCPQCRGVWLDRGELDKIIDRSAAAQPTPSVPPTAPQAAPPPTPQPPYPPQPSAPLHPGGGANPWGAAGYTHGGYGHGKPYYKKRKSWLEEIFD